MSCQSNMSSTHQLVSACQDCFDCFIKMNSFIPQHCPDSSSNPPFIQPHVSFLKLAICKIVFTTGCHSPSSRHNKNSAKRKAVQLDFRNAQQCFFRSSLNTFLKLLSFWMYKLFTYAVFRFLTAYSFCSINGCTILSIKPESVL